MTVGLVVFDGDCGLCNGFVRWLMRADHHARFAIASNGDPVGKAALDAAGVPWGVTVDTLVVIVDQHALLRSAAVIGVLRELSWPWRAVAWLIGVVPRRPRDAVYDAVARRRRRLSSRLRACRVADQEERRQWARRLATMEDVATLAGATETG